jgi:hypothetical protein
MWVLLGASANYLLSLVLKKMLNHERPAPDLRSDPGMPSSHAQSICYAATLLVLSCKNLKKNSNCSNLHWVRPWYSLPVDNEIAYFVIYIFIPKSRKTNIFTLDIWDLVSRDFLHSTILFYTIVRKGCAGHLFYFEKMQCTTTLGQIIWRSSLGQQLCQWQPIL